MDTKYQPWFAWYPVKTEKRWAWLRTIERMRVPFGWFIRERRQGTGR